MYYNSDDDTGRQIIALKEIIVKQSDILTLLHVDAINELKANRELRIDLREMKKKLGLCEEKLCAKDKLAVWFQDELKKERERLSGIHDSIRKINNLDISIEARMDRIKDLLK